MAKVMENIELECPSCTELLEIDAGFAGGICRCSNCGTLMTVPAFGAKERAEALSRPDRPDAPPSAPGGPRRSPTTIDSRGKPAPAPIADDAGGQSEMIIVDEGSLPEEPEITNQAPRGAAPKPITPGGQPQPKIGGEAVTYITSSGRRISVAATSFIPTAQKTKRKIVRATTRLILVGFLLGVIVLIIVIVVSVLSPAARPPEDPALKQMEDVYGRFNTDINPFLVNSSNFLGIPLSPKTVIAIDGSGYSQKWFGLIGDSLMWSANHLPADHSLQVVLWLEEGPQAYPNSLRSWDEKDRARLRRKLDARILTGTAQVIPAVELASVGKPTQVILVTSQLLSIEQLSRLRQYLDEKEPGLRIDAITISSEQKQLGAFLQGRNGRYRSMPLQVLMRWYKDWKAKATETELAAVTEAPADEPLVSADMPFGETLEEALAPPPAPASQPGDAAATQPGATTAPAPAAGTAPPAAPAAAPRGKPAATPPAAAAPAH